MRMTLAITATYQVGCKECMADMENMVASAIRDCTITGLSAKVTEKCEHEAARRLLQGKGPTGLTGGGKQTTTVALEGQGVLDINAGALPNGFDATA